MTSKERAYLIKEANGLETIFQIGKNGIDRPLVEGVADALKARELIKLRVQDSCEYTVREAAEILSGRLAAETVQVIGKRFVLYKRNRKTDRYGVR